MNFSSPWSLYLWSFLASRAGRHEPNLHIDIFAEVFPYFVIGRGQGAIAPRKAWTRITSWDLGRLLWRSTPPEAKWRVEGRSFSEGQRGLREILGDRHVAWTGRGRLHGCTAVWMRLQRQVWARWCRVLQTMVRTGNCISSAVGSHGRVAGGDSGFASQKISDQIPHSQVSSSQRSSVSFYLFVFNFY